jgi:hypothetical protein
MEAFSPVGATVNLTAGTTTGSVALTAFPGNGGADIRVHNAGSVVAFINFGGSTVAATTAAGMPLAASNTAVFSVGPGVTHLAAITASSTAVVYATTGKCDR